MMSMWDVILDEVVVIKVDEVVAMAYVVSRFGEVFAYARFDLGGNVVSMCVFVYMLCLNLMNVVNEDKVVVVFMEDDFIGRWDSAYNIDDWVKYKLFAYV